MSEDSLLFVVVFIVWAGLAVVYATVPLLSMPEYAVVWGWGALVFLVLGWLAARRRKGK